MSTNIGVVRDAVDSRFSLEVEVGTGGVKLFVAAPEGETARKIWLDSAGADALIEHLGVAQFVAFGGKAMANETTSDRRGRQSDELRSHLEGISADAVKALAFEIREAAWIAPDVHRRIIEVFERHGVTWPAGDKP